MISITDLIVYPIKSAAPIELKVAAVEQMGLEFDRRWLLLGADNQMLTARKFPQMLDIKVNLQGDNLQVVLHSNISGRLRLDNEQAASLEFKLWSQMVDGSAVDPVIDAAISDFLGQTCRLVYRSKNTTRPILEKNGGKEGDIVSYADAAPILLMSEASLADLNQRLADPIKADRFRPNIIVKGCEAFAEDSWTHIDINGLSFDVVQGCKRCVLTTIDPITKEKHPLTEPLRTLATYRPHPRGGVSFGVYLIPRKLGTISIGDTLKVS